MGLLAGILIGAGLLAMLAETLVVEGTDRLAHWESNSTHRHLIRWVWIVLFVLMIGVLIWSGWIPRRGDLADGVRALLGR